LERKPLGNTGETAAEVGLGTWLYGGDPAVIHMALECGGNLIDTAEGYKTEDMVGAAMRGNREAYFLATKVSGENLRAADVAKACDASLKRLGTDVIDLYQVHWPNGAIPIAETMEAMARLQREGKIRHVGVSNFSVPQTQEADAALRAAGGAGVVANQVLYSLFARDIEHELIPYCEQNEITVIAYSPLAQGKLGDELKANPAAADALRSVVIETGKTEAQVLLNWCVRSPWVITIPATNKVHRVVEDFAASGWYLTDSQYAALSATTTAVVVDKSSAFRMDPGVPL